jgi:hypothetical protein
MVYDAICWHTFLIIIINIVFHNNMNFQGFKVPTTLKMSIVVLRVVMPCGLVGGFSILEEHIASVFRTT